MDYSEFLDRDLFATPDGHVLDADFNEYRNEAGSAVWLRPSQLKSAFKNRRVVSEDDWEIIEPNIPLKSQIRHKPKGWHHESTRHSLARKGIKTGRKKR